MNLEGTVNIDVIGGENPGDLSYRLRFTSPDGKDLMTGESTPIAAGETVSFGPVLVGVTLGAADQKQSTASSSAPGQAHQVAKNQPGQTIKPGTPGQPPRR